MSINKHHSASGQHVSSLPDIAQEVAAICLLKISVLSRSRFYRPIAHDQWVVPTLCCCMISEWFPHCAAAWSVSVSHTVLLHDQWVVPTLCCCMIIECFPHCAAAWSVSGSHTVLLHDQSVVPTLCCCCRTLVLHKLRHVFYNWNDGKNEKCPTAYMIHGDRYRMYSAVKWVIRDFRMEFRKTWNLQ